MVQEAGTTIKRILKNFDKRLRLRWSLERKCWVLEEKIKRPDLMPLPVRSVLINGKEEEILLPELSDRRIQYKDKYLPICYLTNNSMLTENLLGILKAIKITDKADAIKNMEAKDTLEEIQREKRIKEKIDGLSREIYDYGNTRGKSAKWNSIGA